MLDPYQVLGVSRGANQAEVKQSYRRLAKEWHPDRQQGDSAATDKFKEIAAAYHLLGDARQRSRFDRGEIDAAGNHKPNFHKSRKARAKTRTPSGSHKASNDEFSGAEKNTARGAARRSSAKSPDTNRRARQPAFENFGFGGFSASDIFQPFFRNRQNEKEKSAPAGGAKDQRYKLEIGLLDAIKGGKKLLTLKDGRDIHVTVPAATEEGQIIRLRSMGDKPADGGQAGDALVEISITPHPHFLPLGKDIHLELPITVQEAVAGARMDVPTINGPVTVTVPKGSNAGTRLRLKGKGIPDKNGGAPGDQHLTLRIVLPENNAAFERLVGDWARENQYDVRGGFRPRK